MTASRAFAPDHPWDRNAHLAFVLIAWGATILGFGSSLVERLAGHADYPRRWYCTRTRHCSSAGWVC